MNWEQNFDFLEFVTGATRNQLTEFEETVFAPTSNAETARILAGQLNPFLKNDPLYNFWKPVNPVTWKFPSTPFPSSFLDFLSWSNGSVCMTGDREFHFSGTENLRQLMLGYHVPEYMPLAVPFALNGGGIFYLFDMRSDPIAGEYPIIISESNVLDFAESKQIASSFHEACSQKWT